MSREIINAFGKTDVGLMRTINQDSIFTSIEPIGKLLIFLLLLTVWEDIRQVTLHPGLQLRSS